MPILTYPDYQNSIINLMSSLLLNYDIKTSYKPLDAISQTEVVTKQNVILMIFDGYGYNLLKKYYKCETKYFYKNLLQPISTVFPSTTTSAITSFYTAQAPLEHASLGWSLYFKEFFKMIEYLPNCDHILNTKLKMNKYDVYRILNPENIFNKINQHRSDVDLHYITPKYLSNTPFTKFITQPAKIHSYKNIKNLFSLLQKILRRKQNNQKFIVTYSTNPDGLEHKHGVFSEEVRSFLQQIDELLEEVVKKNKNSNTTIFITADHGLINMKKYIYLNEIPEIDECMILPPFPEPRFTSFFVKTHKMEQFRNEISKFKNEFHILSREELFRDNLLGFGKDHPKIDDFIGDFVAIAKDHTGFSYKFQHVDPHSELVAHHCGLTEDEMIVPLIKIDL